MTPRPSPRAPDKPKALQPRKRGDQIKPENSLKPEYPIIQTRSRRIVSRSSRFQ